MTKKLKKFLATLLAMCMILSMASVSAFATGEGDELENNEPVIEDVVTGDNNENTPETCEICGKDPCECEKDQEETESIPMTELVPATPVENETDEEEPETEESTFFSVRVAEDPEAQVGETSYGTLQEAINNAGENGVVTLLRDITVREMVKVEDANITLNLGGYTINGGCTFNAADTAVAEESRGIGSTILAVFRSTVTVENGTITGGYGDNKAGGIYALDSALTLTGVHVDKNFATGFGGGMFIEGSGSFTMTGGSISDNKVGGTTTQNGGGLYIKGWDESIEVVMTGVTVSGNKAPAYAGGIRTWRADMTLNNVTISDNESWFGGGILLGSDTDLEMNGGEITGNRALGCSGEQYGKGAGAGMYIDRVRNKATLNGVTVTGNTASSGYEDYHGNGGGIFISAPAESEGNYTTLVLGADNVIEGNTSYAGDSNIYVCEKATTEGGVPEDESKPVTAVAEVNGKKYASLQAAIDNCPEGGTVTLVDNVVLDTQIVINKGITLDLNGQQISRNPAKGISSLVKITADVVIQDSGDEGIIKADKYTTTSGKTYGTAVTVAGGSLTVKSGTVYGGKYGISIKNGTVVDLTGGKVAGNTAVDMQGGTINVSENALVEGGWYGISLQNAEKASGFATLNMTGGTVKTNENGGQAICGNNVWSQGCNATISGGTIEAGTGVFWPMSGTLTIEGDANITGRLCGIEVKQGTVNITGGTITCTGDYAEYVPSNDGTVGSGWALAVSARHYSTDVVGASKDIEINITGGKLISENGNAIELREKTENAKDTSATITIAGGTVKGALAAIHTAVENGSEGTELNAKITIPVSGGTFSSDVSDYCVDGSQAKEETEGVWTIVPAEDSVAAIGNVGYATLQEAIDAAGTDATEITMLADSNLPAIIPAGKNIILNVPEGITLSNEDGSFGVSWGNTTIQNHGALTITGAGTILSEKQNNHVLKNFEGATANLNGCTFKTTVNDYVIWNLGTMTIDGATVDNTNADNNDNTVIYNGWRETAELAGYQTERKALLTVKSGTIMSNTASKNAILNTMWATLVIEGGNISAPRCIGNYDITEIKGGTFTVTRNDGRIILTAGGSDNYSRGQLTITGGTFLKGSDVEATLIQNSTSSGTNRKTAISGGAFAAPVQLANCADGFLPVANNDNTYGVTNELHLTATPASLNGAGTVTLRVTEKLTTEEITVECDDTAVTVTKNADGTWTTSRLPNRTVTYTFTVTVGTKTATCTVSVSYDAPYVPPVVTPDEPDEDLGDDDTPLADRPWLFVDVHEGDYFYDAVKRLFDKNIVGGTTDTTYEPYTDATRGMVAQILYGMAGSPDVTGLEMPFTDVSESDFYYKAVLWGYANKVLGGYPEDNTFRGENTITREELAALLHQYGVEKLGLADTKGDLSGFIDAAEISDWAVEHMKWAVGMEIMHGDDAKKLMPVDNTIRADMTIMLNNLDMKVSDEK